jgi:hypothetical protein
MKPARRLQSQSWYEPARDEFHREGREQDGVMVYGRRRPDSGTALGLSLPNNAAHKTIARRRSAV